MFLRNKEKRNKGIALMELLIYISMLAVLGVLTINTLLTMTKSFAEAQAGRSLARNGHTSLERLSRDIREAESVNTEESVFGVHPGVLVINTVDDSGTPLELRYEIVNGVLRVYENDVDRGALTSSMVSIDSLVYRLITTPEGNAVKIEATFSYTRGAVERTATFYDTIILRGSY